MRLVALAVLGAASLCAETPAELEKLLATATEPGVVMVEIARQYAIAGDRNQALAWFQKAVALNPEYTPEFDRAKLRPISILKVKLQALADWVGARSAPAEDIGFRGSRSGRPRLAEQ